VHRRNQTDRHCNDEIDKNNQVIGKTYIFYQNIPIRVKKNNYIFNAMGKSV
jgi:hypothetical protein